VTNISESFAYKMAAKINWNKITSLLLSILTLETKTGRFTDGQIDKYHSVELSVRFRCFVGAAFQ